MKLTDWDFEDPYIVMFYWLQLHHLSLDVIRDVKYPSINTCQVSLVMKASEQNTRVSILTRGNFFWMNLFCSFLLSITEKVAITRKHSSGMHTDRLHTIPASVASTRCHSQGDQVVPSLMSWLTTRCQLQGVPRFHVQGYLSQWMGYPTMWPNLWCIWCPLPTPLPRGHTDACENITLSQFTGGSKIFHDKPYSMTPLLCCQFQN